MTTDRETVQEAFVTRGSRPSFASPVAEVAVENGAVMQGAVMGAVMRGTVKWFNADKGWGFIKQELGPDVFVHYSQIEVGTMPPEERRVLLENELVLYELTEGPKGLLAVNVKRVRSD
jgi:cold shock protein